MKLLLVEDDREMAADLSVSLEGAGHGVALAHDGADGLAAAEGGTFDVIVLDRMLPKVDGVTVVRRLRTAGVTTPILLLTAMGGVDDRVEGLDAGADDYLIKPFAFAELLARVNALGRRPSSAEPKLMQQVADLRIDKLARIATRGGDRLDLQPREFKLLEYLMRNAGRTVTRSMLLEAVWDFHFDPKTNIVETHMSRLRSKINRGDDPELIQTVRGVGYCLREP